MRLLTSVALVVFNCFVFASTSRRDTEAFIVSGFGPLEGGGGGDRRFDPSCCGVAVGVTIVPLNICSFFGSRS